MTYDEMIAIIQAAKGGKTIQMKTHDKWATVHHPRFNFNLTEYRIKPKPREWFVYENPVERTIYSHCLGAYHPKPIRVREVLED